MIKILVLNAGSSTQKSCLYALAEDALPSHPPQPIWEGFIDWKPQQNREIKAEIKIEIPQGESCSPLLIEMEVPINDPGDRTAAIEQMLQTLWQGDAPVISSHSEIDIAGHRVVHGGHQYRHSTLVDVAVKQAIADLATFAPIHNPVNLEGIMAIEKILGDLVPQVAVFDTAFHAQLPEAAAIYPIPYEFYEQGVRRYGFHGISHQYVAQRAAEILGRDLTDLKLVTCHLGNGCSLAAIQNGYSIDTTMGFTPLAGLMMGSRSGDIDPGILIYLMQQKGYTAQQIDDLLNRASGLLGISGISNDMRQILAAIADGNARARLAYDIYIYRLRSLIGSMVATLGGIDALVFTAGVGENAATVRTNVCEAFSFLGLKIDIEQNSHRPVDRDIAAPDSSVRVLVVHTQEDWAIARECWQILRDPGRGNRT
jgi:acetate kinase